MCCEQDTQTTPSFDKAVQCVSARCFEEEIGGIFVVRGAKGLFGRCAPRDPRRTPLLSSAYQKRSSSAAFLQADCSAGSAQECAPNSRFPLIDYFCVHTR